jgi:hypothetical protein
MNEIEVNEKYKDYQKRRDQILREIELLDRESNLDKRIEIINSIANGITFIEEQLQQDKKNINEMPSSKKKERIEESYKDIDKFIQPQIDKEKYKVFQIQEKIFNELDSKSRNGTFQDSNVLSQVDAMIRVVGARQTPFVLDYINGLVKFREHVASKAAQKDLIEQQNKMAATLGEVTKTFVTYLDTVAATQVSTVGKLQANDLERSIKDFKQEVEDGANEPGILVMKYLQIIEGIMSHKIVKNNTLPVMKDLLQENANNLRFYKPFNTLDDQGLPELIVQLNQQSDKLLMQNQAMLQACLSLYQFINQGIAMEYDETFQQRFEDKARNLISSLKATDEQTKQTHDYCKKLIEESNRLFAIELKTLFGERIMSEISYRTQFDKNDKALRELRGARSATLLYQNQLISMLTSAPEVFLACAHRDKVIADIVQQDPDAALQSSEQLLTILHSMIAHNKVLHEFLDKAFGEYQQELMSEVGHHTTSVPTIASLDSNMRGLVGQNNEYEEKILNVLEDINDIVQRVQYERLNGESSELDQALRILQEKMQDVKSIARAYQIELKQTTSSLLSDMQNRQTIINSFTGPEKQFFTMGNQNLQVQTNMLLEKSFLLVNHLERQASALSTGLKTQQKLEEVRPKADNVIPPRTKLLVSYGRGIQNDSKTKSQKENDPKTKQQKRPK